MNCPMPRQEKKNYSIKAVENSLLFLKALCEEEREISITCLSKKLRLTKNHVFRLMATFEKWGYVEQINSSGKYRLGLGASVIGQKLISRVDLFYRAKSVMEKLALECDETVYLAVNTGREFVLLDKVDAANPVNIVPLIGKHYLLSWGTAGEIRWAFDAGTKDCPYTEKTMPSEESKIGILPRGFSVEIGGLGDGVASLAVPIINEQNKIVGCLCFVVPQFRFTKERIQSKLLPSLKAAGQIISSGLSYSSHRII